MSEVLLSRINPEANCFRFYEIAIEPNLFGDHALVIHWGRIGKRGNTRIASTGDLDFIEAKASRLERQKVRRGYCHTSKLSQPPQR